MKSKNDKSWQQLQWEQTVKNYTALYTYCYNEVSKSLPPEADRDIATNTVFSHILNKRYD